jgi:hypothetical protein
MVSPIARLLARTHSPTRLSGGFLRRRIYSGGQSVGELETIVPVLLSRALHAIDRGLVIEYLLPFRGPIRTSESVIA